MAKDAYFFSHDANARNDTKILSMRCDYGLKGYAMYFIIVECMRDEEDYKLLLDDNTSRALAMQMHSKTDIVGKFITDCINLYSLFQSDGATFWSDSLLRRMSKVQEIREARKLAAAKRWGSDANAMQENSKCNANAMQLDAKEKKVKEKKVKNIYISDCEYLWNLYPEKDGKIPAMKKLPGLIEKYGKDQIERTIKRYIESVDQRRAKGFPDLKFKNGSTFFNSGYGDYLDENQQTDEKPLKPFKPTWVYREL